jgi:hypothetical protein
LLWQRLQVQPIPLDRARPELTFGPDLSRVVMKALERERENRYTSADEMQRAIAEAMDSLRAERERAEAARLAAERRREEAEAARLAAEEIRREQQERERRERETAEAVRLAAERRRQEAEAARLAAEGVRREQQERERHERQCAESARLAAEARQAQQDRETVASANLPRPERVVPPAPEPKRSATTVPSKQPRAHANWLKWLVCTALLAILGIGLAIWLSQPAANQAPATPASPVGGRLDQGNALLRNGDYAGAIAEFKAVLQTDPGNAAAQAALRDAQSAWDAEKSLAGSTFDVAGILRQASEKRAAGMYGEAINLYQSVLAHDASNREARRGLADSRSALDAERKAFGKQ